MTTSPTYGPWNVQQVGTPGYYVINDASGIVVPMTGERGLANARLKAAAPTLFDACALALALVKATFPREHGNEQVGRAWGALESAINKAKGN